MDLRTAAAVLLVMATSACVTAKPGQKVGAATVGPLSGIAGPVEFDHACPKERIRLIRSHGERTVDLDVCGSVRRYKSFAPGSSSDPVPTWLDVTSLYPPGTLPAPLPPL
jgi:hypothetical protein